MWSVEERNGQKKFKFFAVTYVKLKLISCPQKEVDNNEKIPNQVGSNMND